MCDDGFHYPCPNCPLVITDAQESYCADALGQRSRIYVCSCGYRLTAFGTVPRAALTPSSTVAGHITYVRPGLEVTS